MLNILFLMKLDFNQEDLKLIDDKAKKIISDFQKIMN